MRNKKNISIKEIIRSIVFVIALLVFIGSAYKLYSIWNEYNKNSTAYEELREYSPEEITKEDGKISYKIKPEDYQKLFDINSDLKGWITIPNTDVNYPIVQTTDNSYYLTYNFNKEENDGGAIFIASENATPFKERNTIIHGHHMKDGSMFASLRSYKEPSFLESNNKIYISTKDEVLIYEIFSVYVEKASSDPYKYSFSNDEEYVSYLKSLNENSYTRIDTNEFTKDDQIITLSTCTYEVEDGRLLVHARLIGRE